MLPLAKRMRIVSMKLETMSVFATEVIIKRIVASAKVALPHRLSNTKSIV